VSLASRAGRKSPSQNSSADLVTTECPADPAIGGTVVVDFTKGSSPYFGVAEGTTLNYDPSKGAVFQINKDGEAPTITSKGYIFFGKLEVELQTSVGIGVVTSVVLQSDCLDEIDWEWLGGDTTQVQTNYFSKGDTSTYDRGGFSPVNNPQTQFHTYTIDWTPEHVQWIIDGNVVRTLTYGEAKGGASFPQTPMQIKLGTWVAGRQGAPQGTVQWAGGYTNFADAPFTGYYRKVTITDYGNGKSGATSYSYGDSSGTMGSIVVSTDGSNSAAFNESSSANTDKPTASTTKPLTQATNKPKNTTSVSTTMTTAATQSGPTGGSQPTGPSQVTPNAGLRVAANLFAAGAAAALCWFAL
jgi:beta-glucanase (GH16 family)